MLKRAKSFLPFFLLGLLIVLSACGQERDTSVVDTAVPTTATQTDRPAGQQALSEDIVVDVPTNTPIIPSPTPLSAAPSPTTAPDPTVIDVLPTDDLS
ncbi:MAG: hypothetical protein GY943_16125, partial [Chloroflexi bacterium]|nr:hypothetical protein [Chloroflexota bacterium]